MLLTITIKSKISDTDLAAIAVNHGYKDTITITNPEYKTVEERDENYDVSIPQYITVANPLTAVQKGALFLAGKASEHAVHEISFINKDDRTPNQQKLYETEVKELILSNASVLIDDVPVTI